MIFLLLIASVWGSWPEAFNQAITNIAYQGNFEILRYSHVPLVVCSPQADWSSQDSEDVQDIRERGELVVGVLGGNFGEDGDYTVDPPVGYFPDLIRAIHRELNIIHELNVPLKFEMFNSSDRMLADWKSGRVYLDFTDPSFLISGLWQPPTEGGINLPRRARIADFKQACPLIATPTTMIVPINSSITTMTYLVEYLMENGGIVTVVSEGNRDVLSPWFPKHRVDIVVVQSVGALCADVISGRATAAFITGDVPCDGVDTYTTEVLAIHAAFVRPSASAWHPATSGLLVVLGALLL